MSKGEDEQLLMYLCGVLVLRAGGKVEVPMEDIKVLEHYSMAWDFNPETKMITVTTDKESSDNA